MIEARTAPLVAPHPIIGDLYKNLSAIGTMNLGPGLDVIGAAWAKVESETGVA